ncbi:MAG: PAS domain S-box protein, partial [Chthoniobacterales bacterium]|nr:PAS domain S-box protein [Chthoniobacterales bacterium]
MAGGVEPRHPGVRARTHHHHGCTGKVREFNPAAERVFGYSREQAVGKDWPSSSFHQPCDRSLTSRARDENAGVAAVAIEVTRETRIDHNLVVVTRRGRV